MFIQTSLVFLLWAFTSVFAAPPSLAPGAWYEVPDSALSKVGYPWPAGSTWGAIKWGVMSESGGAYDTSRDCLMVWGGGHSDYAGNEIYSFCLDTMQWSRLNDPTLNTDRAGVTEASGFYPDAQGQPDTQQPRSGHSYNNLQYVPARDALCLFGNPVMYRGGQKNGDYTACWSLQTRQWQVLPSDHTQKASFFIGAVTATHPWTGDVYGLGTISRPWLSRWQPATNTWKKLLNVPTEQYAYYRTAVIDPVQQQLVVVAGCRGSGTPACSTPRKSYTIDLNTPTTLVPITMTGAEPLRDGVRNPGLAWHPPSQRIIAWNGGATVYALDTKTRVWSAVNSSLPSTTTPTPPAPTGTYGRWAYSPKYDLFLVVNGINQPVYLYRLNWQPPVTPPPVQPPPPNLTWQVPSLQDERDAYARWGWTWTPQQEPQLLDPYTGKPGQLYTVVDPDIHGDTEGDDLWEYLQMARRTGQAGYQARRDAWAAYSVQQLRQCTGGRYRNYCYDRDGFGLDHAYGWGLLELYLDTQDRQYLDIALAILGDIQTLYDKPKYVPGKYAMSTYGPRAGARHLLLATRAASITRDARWIALRDKLIALWLQSPDWDVNYGMYWLSQYTTDAYLNSGTYGKGVRLQSAFQVGILAEAFAQAYQATSDVRLRDRLVAMAQMVARYAFDPVTGYAGYLFGVNLGTGAQVLSNTYKGGVASWNPTYTLSLVGTLVYGGRYGNNPGLTALAQRAYACGTQGKYGTTSPCVPSPRVAHFIDTMFDSSSANFYLSPGKAPLFYTYPVFVP